MQKSSLKEYYDKAIIMSRNGEITASALQKTFGLHPYGAACLIYMLVQDEYCPELEDVYKNEELPMLVNKTEDTYKMIRFLEDFTPFKKTRTYSINDLSKEDMEKYVNLGIARWIDFEEYRLEIIHIYVNFKRIIEQQTADMHEALAHRDKKFFSDYFADSNKDTIIKSLKRDKFTEDEIDKILALLDYK